MTVGHDYLKHNDSFKFFLQENNEAVTDQPGAQGGDAVIAMPATNETEDDQPVTQQPRSSPKAEKAAAIPLPPPDETTALNPPGEKKAYTPGN